MNVIYILFFYFILGSTSFLHDFHISRTEINYDQKTHEVQIAVHLFIDDFEAALVKSGSPKLHLCTPKEDQSTDDAIEKYLNNKMKIYVAGKPITATFLGKETSTDKMAVWCYLEISNIKTISELAIENKLLNEMFNDQKNITDFTVNKKRKAFFIFDSEKTLEKISL
ncbi:MAG TPA: hypothetical protein PKD51_11640 [Saprospiraceae bacterium]|mgnify:CR=1 FL=1|nr:hypothetical protein [Saprospiraceae bacterium]HMU02383.1 hypothetical protein [Saprospiraceae bacterium]